LDITDLESEIQKFIESAEKRKAFDPSLQKIDYDPVPLSIKQQKVLMR